ncbi:hypothetical protein OPQ81_007066 [Rhizoctonia solani]|nr:hypothetical protein OPQ81_007066 [Rhizoctonia solani]
MAVQSAINAAISALRSAVGNNNKQKANLNKIRDEFKAVEADEWPRSEVVEHGLRLAEIIFENVASLHKAHPQPTLAFCAVAMSWLFKAKLEPAIERGDEENAKTWEDIMFRGLVQPILNIANSEDQDLEAVGNSLYQTICGVMRSPWSHGFGGRFARSLALVLVCTCSSSSNKAMLLDPSTFGTDTLSKLIIDAKDYHYLDTLLELSFTMFSSQGGKVTRKSYAHSIFSSGYALENLPDDISNELVSIHSLTNGDNSEKHVFDIIRTMSRAGIERPQIFMTKDLSYCGTRFTQTAPSNVIILDRENICIIFCDKKGDSDVLAVANTTVKSVELVPQGTSRIVVELVVTDQPLISSSREELAAPGTHIPGSPLNIRFSVSLSDAVGLEAALTARDLAGALKDGNALTQDYTLGNMKISNAASRIHLKKSRNTSNEQAEEMIHKYVNLPSSRDPSSPLLVEPTNKSTARTAQPRPLLPRAPVSQATAIRKVTSPQTEKLCNEFPSASRPVPKATLLPPVSVLAQPPVTQRMGTTTTRTKITAAQKAHNATKLAALADMDDSELTDIDPGIIPSHPEQQKVAKPPANNVIVLPTPPRTRARAQQIKPVAKTLVPSTPTKDGLPAISSPLDIPSPSPKPLKKRKLVEDDPFELPPLKPERPAKQKKTVVKRVILSSQHIQPGDTIVTRAKTKYGATSKRMRALSPVESIHSADIEEAGSPRKKAPIAIKGKKRGGVLEKDKTATRTQARLDMNESDVPKRRTRASTANAKLNPAASPDMTNTTQNKEPELNITVAPEAKLVDTSELPKKKRGRPPKNKPTQKPFKIPEPLSGTTNSTERALVQLEPQGHSARNEAKSTRTCRSYKAEPIPATAAQETIVATQEQVTEDDDLLERLSQAAKKTLRPSVMDELPVFSSRRASSPVKISKIEMEDPDVDIDTIEPPAQELETCSPKGITRQVRDATPESVENNEIHPTIKLFGARLGKRPVDINATNKESNEPPNVRGDNAPKSKICSGVTQPSTRPQSPKDKQTAGARDEGIVDIIGTENSPPISPVPTGAVNKTTRPQDSNPRPTVTRSKTRAPTPREKESNSPPPPQALVQHQPGNTVERIQHEEIQAMAVQSSVHQVETLPGKDTCRTRLPPVFISVDSNSDVDMEPLQELASPQADVEPIRRLSVPTSRTTSTTRSVVKPQFHRASASASARGSARLGIGIGPAPAPAKAKHAAFTKVLFDTSTQPSPKSALASPQRRTLANGTRPSVSFLEPPIPTPLSRSGSSGSSIEAAQKQQVYGIDREKLRKGHSARTGDVMLEIAVVLTEIQDTIASNLGEKIQTVNAEARRARAKLTKGVIEELDKMIVESESHHDVLHEFENAFASQAQAMLEGFGRVAKRNDRMNGSLEDILSSNARVGQIIANNTLNFRVPELFNTLLTS